jgi:hypothetical protein
VGEALIELHLIWDITWHAIVQSILLWIPLLKPLVEMWIPPWWWQACYYNQHWQENLDAELRPTELFMDYYWQCIFSHVYFMASLLAMYFADEAQGLLFGFLGILHEAYLSFSEWIQAIADLVGELLPEWATSVMDALQVLWELLPEEIRDGLQTWAEFLEAAPEALQAWVEELVGQTIAWVIELWDWYIGLGQTITKWWTWAHDELNELLGDAYGWIVRALGEAWAFLIWFWGNPSAAVTTWLSPWWESLVTFASDCLDFWYNLWGSYADLLSEFLEDPLGYLWREGEGWLNERLERP